MNVFARIEHVCARVVEDAFARVFPSALDPAQIGRRLVATAQASPSDLYLVRVHPTDYGRLAGDRDFLEGRWSAMLREVLPAQRAASARVLLDEDPDVVSGSLAIEAVVDERVQTLALERPDCTRVALADGLTLGRGDDND
ncbi:MAG TPA: FhaA domain-containing protein, partial [Candidatus Elarobacter sp.]